jgi:D-cysteine desulfhydrase family pyridoxal phosphate-dependent enzyme
MQIHEKKISFLGKEPTALQALPRLSEMLGVSLYIKRDDLTPFGGGGNKLRKLEYLLYDAMEKGATALITVGGAQTNHGRLTAAVAAKYGMKCTIVCIDDYPGEISANLLLDGLMGADVVIKKNDGRGDDIQFEEAVAEVRKKYEAEGETVYFIPVGGSNVIGALGYYEAAVEITKQADEMGLNDATLITAVGSMGTYVGLYCGLKNEQSPLNLIGIAISPFNDVKETRIVSYFNEFKETFDLKLEATRADFHIETGYSRGAYNNPDITVRKAIYTMGEKEAILFDPCYTGKMFAGVLEMIESGKIQKGEKIILLHTGGFPGLYTKHHRVEMEAELKHHITVIE